MKLPNFSIVKLMVIVGIAALNLAAVRIFLLDNSEMLIGVALIGLALQVGIFRLMRSRGQVRAFWAGFVACGLMAMMTFIWAIIFAGVLGIDFKGSLGMMRMPGSPFYTIWQGYADFVSRHIITPVLDYLRINPAFFYDSVLGRAFP